MEFFMSIFPSHFGSFPDLNLVYIHWIQYTSSAIYVGMLFFYLCIIPKGSLQSASIEKTYRKIFGTSFVFLFLSTVLSFSFNPSRFQQIWFKEFVIILLLIPPSLKMFVKKNHLFFWIAFILGICFQVFMGWDAPYENGFLAIMLKSLRFFSASILLGSLVALVTLLPVRKREEGKLFFRGLIHLFIPWGGSFLLIFAATVFSSWQ